MAIAAHDLRSPLYGLRNLLDLAERRADADPSLPRRVLRDAIESLDAMQALVTGLLDAHAAEHAPLGAPVHEDLYSAVQAAATRAKPLSLSKSVTIEHQFSKVAAYTVVDGSPLARILDNLLVNAIQHSSAGCKVSIAVWNRGGDTLIAIRDQGPGIAPERHPFLFRKFDRTGAAVDVKGGSGMGLFIAATFAARLGATLRYRAGEPLGAIFELSIPNPKCQRHVLMDYGVRDGCNLTGTDLI
jgi:signal transduction histidine kinase